MATYKYQQNMFDGAAEGYVKYNITPDFGTPLTVGSVIEISGLMYWRDSKIYGIQLATDTFSEMGVSRITASKGVATAFTIRGVVTQAIANQLTQRAENVPIKFTLYGDEALSSGSATFPVAGQEIYVFKQIASPSVYNAIFYDETGAQTRFNGLIQNKSLPAVEFDYDLDSTFPDMAVKTVEIFLEAASGTVPLPYTSMTIPSLGHMRVYVAPITGVYTSARLKVSITDTRGQTAYAYATPVTGSSPFDVYAYSPPAITTIKGYSLARRYDYKENDYGEKEAVFTAEGRFVSLNFEMFITDLPGGNPWTIRAEYANEGSENYQEVVEGWTPGSGGGTFQYFDNRTIIPDSRSFYPGLNYNIRLTVNDFFETAVLVGTIDKATAYMHLTKYGFALFMRSTADAMHPKFESAVPAFMYQGIHGISYLEEGEAMAGVSPDGVQLYAQTVKADVSAGAAVSIPISKLGAVFRIDGVIIAPNQSVWPVNCYVNSNAHSACYRSGSARALTLSTAGMTGTAYVSVLYSKADTEDPTTEYLWNNGAVGYAWEGNAYTRPAYTNGANGVVDANALKVTIGTVTGANAIPFNAHVCTADVISIPSGLTRLNVSAKKTSSNNTYLNFGLLPENASNSYSTASGGQLSGELTLSTAETVYTLELNPDVYALANIKCIINGKANMKNGTVASGVIITKVWFD